MKQNKIIAGALFAALVIALIVWFAIAREDKRTPEAQELSPVEVMIEETKFSKTSSTEEKLPSGFPIDIPVEGNIVDESYKASYPQSGAIQHSYTYRSTQSMEEKAVEYKTYLEENEYVITDEFERSNFVSLYGKKGNNDLSVVINDVETDRIIQLSYLARQ